MWLKNHRLKLLKKKKPKRIKNNKRRQKNKHKWQLKMMCRIQIWNYNRSNSFRLINSKLSIKDTQKSKLFNTPNKNNFHLELHKSYPLKKILRHKKSNQLMETQLLHLLLRIGTKKKLWNYLRKSQQPNKFNKLKI